MTLYLSPYRRMTSLLDTMDRMFDESFARRTRLEGETLALDVQALDDEFVITTAVPGFKAEDVTVNVLEDSVTITAEHKDEREEKQNGYLLRELRNGRFARRLTLPAAVDASKVEARLSDGILTLHLPRAESAKVKVIKVKAK